MRQPAMMTGTLHSVNGVSDKDHSYARQSKSKQDFQPLSAYIETLKRPAYCGVASSVMVLNALGSKRQGYRPLTQDTFFDGQTQNIRSSYAVTFSGMTLDELASLLRSHNVKVEVYYASETTLNQFRAQAKANLTRSGDYIIVNYQRSVLGQGKSGHISPLAAYHEQSDLVFDCRVSASNLVSNVTDTKKRVQYYSCPVCPRDSIMTLFSQ